MDLVRIGELGVSFQHQHEDGTWGTFEATGEHHDPSDHDPGARVGERHGLPLHQCDEEIVVTASRGARGAARR